MKFIFLNLVSSAFVFFLSEASLAVSPTTAALAMTTGQISIWDWSTNNFSYVFNGVPEYNVFFLKDGRLATQSNSTQVNILNVTSGIVELTLNCTGFVFEELYNGLFIAGDMAINVWNISSGATLVKTLILDWEIWYLKVLSVSNLLAVSLEYSSSLFLYNPANDFVFYKKLDGHTNSISIIEELPNGNIITCSQDQTVKLWNITQSDFLTSLNPLYDQIYGLKMISRDTFIIGGISNLMYIYKINSLNELDYNSSWPIPSSASQVNDIQVSKTNLVLIAFDDSSLLLYNRTNMALIKSFAVNNKTAGYAQKFGIPDQTTLTNKSIWKQFIFLFDYTMGPSTAFVATFQIENRLKCLIVCANDPSCRAVTFDNNKNCTMFSAYPLSNGESLIPLIGTNLHYKF